MSWSITAWSGANNAEVQNHSMPNVSIITPTAHRSAYLPLLYQCVCNQHGIDWEWLVLDDSPHADAWMQNTARDDARVTYIHSPTPLTIGEKRNQLIEQAQYEHIAHFDDDDHYAPHYLSTLVGHLVNNRADLIKLSAFYLRAPKQDFFGYMDLTAKTGHHYVLNQEEIEHITFHDKMQIGADFIVFYGFSYVYRRDTALRHPFEAVSFCEDEYFVKAIIHADGSVITMPDTTGLCLHLVHGSSSSRCFSRYSMPKHLIPVVFPHYREL